MTLNSGFASFSRKLTLACLIALALPASASAVTVTPTAATVAEGNTGTVDVTFDVACELGDAGALSAAPAAGSAPAATSDQDFEAASSGTLLPACLGLPVPAGTVTVKVKGDTADEPNEKFKLNVMLDAAVTSSSDVTITDDDVPTATIAPVALATEGDSGTTNATIDVTLVGGPSWQELTIPYSTADNEATAGPDYTAASGDLKIAAGQTVGQIVVPIVGDTTNELPETFFVNLGDTNVANVKLDNTKRQGRIGIFDNDPKPPGLFSLGPGQRVTEGDSGTVNMIFTVTLSPALDEPTQIAWKTANWTANLADYEGGQGILKFAAGETSKTFSVNVKGDTRKEPEEVFGVIIEKPTVGQVKTGGGAALGTIVDDDSGDEPTPPGTGPKVKIAKPTRDGKRLSTLLTCPATATACNGTLTAARGKLRVGKGRFELLPGGETDLTFKISKKAMKKLRKRGLRVKFTAVAKNTAGAQGTSTKTFKIKKIKRA